jgi:hypothetical protein
MKNPFSKYNIVWMLAGCILSGLSIYFILSFLLIPLRITVPASLNMCLIVLGLTFYYYPIKTRKKQEENLNDKIHGTESYDKDDIAKSSRGKFLFLATYFALLIVLTFFSNSTNHIVLFANWNDFTPSNFIQLIAAIAFCFFFPGYALVTVIDRKHKMSILTKSLLGYLLSLLISGLSSYVLSSVYAHPNTTIVLLSIYAAILIIFILSEVAALRTEKYTFQKLNLLGTLRTEKNRILSFLSERRGIEFSVFGSLFIWIVLTTYVFYNGSIIGDQWFHHGRAINFVSGSFKDLAAYGLDVPYPPFLSSLLAPFFQLSGIPSVNAYVSINFLNIVPVLAFYYFFTRWMPNKNYKRAGLLASTLFMLSSGFGWAEVLNMAMTNMPISSELSSLEILNDAGRKSFDIRLPNTFIDVGNPEATTGLPIIALPAGFFLLGILKEKRISSSRVIYIGIITAVCTLGILSHDEFYLFVIVASLIPLIFRLDESGDSKKYKYNIANYIYFSFLIALSIIFVIDNVLPGKYYTFREIGGIPLITLCFIFVIFMWILCIFRVLHRLHIVGCFLLRSISFLSPNSVRLRYEPAIIITLIVAFLYLFAFIMWSHFSLKELYPQTTMPSEGQIIIPWYLYPMKLGVTGMLGIAFILSYLFKRFEKEIFVFGIIAVFALLAGPYYDEHRFSKYITASMAAFASLLIYKIIVSLKNRKLKPLLTGIIFGLVITSSCLSILMYHGYSGLGLRNPDFAPFYQIMGTRVFPSHQDLALHEFIHSNLFENPKTDYFAMPANEYGKHSGLKAQLVGFSGIPNTKIWQSPLTMNSSTIEGFYYLLDRSDSKYIIIPKQDRGGENMTGLTMPVRFALQNFEKSYENNKYIVLSVPSMAPPSPKGDVAVIYPRNTLLSSVMDKKTLDYNNQAFEKVSRSEFAKVQNTNAILHGDDKKRTLWSEDMKDQGLNYIEGRFRIISAGIDGHEKNPDSNAGIVWNDDNSKENYLSLDKQTLKLEQKSISKSSASHKITATYNFDDEGLYDWHSFIIVSLRKSIHVYVDNMPILEAPRDPPDDSSFMSQVGIRSSKSLVEFEPMKVGRVNESASEEYQKREYYEHYYPVNALSLSNTGYDTFIYGDSSALSKRNAIITWDPVQDNISNYLKFVKSGGTLVVTHTGGEYAGIFSKELSVRPANKVEFTSIQNAEGIPINISGFATKIKSDSPDVKVKSFYSNGNGQFVAPFAIEKNYDRGGRIIFVNMEGYYDAISKRPHIFFKTLGHISDIIGLEVDSYSGVEVHDTKPVARVVGNLTPMGNVSIMGSSLLFSENASESNVFSAELVSISNQKNSYLQDNKTGDQKGFRNALITDLKLSGQYEVEIYSSSTILPTISSALYGYVPMTIPPGSDIQLKLGKGGRAEFLVNGSDQIIRINSGNVTFQEVALDSQSKPGIFILMKAPHIRVNGSTQFTNIISEDLTTSSSKPAQVNGSLMLKFNHLDRYYENSRSEIETKYVTYLNDIDIQSPKLAKLDIKIPGDISQSAKEQGVKMPWKKALLSDAGIILILGISIVSAVTLPLAWKDRLKVQRHFK